jgi:cell division protein FtsB
MGSKLAAWVILMVGVVAAANSGASVWRLYKASGRLHEEQRQLAEAKATQDQLKKKLAEVQTQEFVEKEAREKLGLGKDGEVVVVIPKETLEGATVGIVAPPEANWVKWRRLYLGL